MPHRHTLTSIPRGWRLKKRPRKGGQAGPAMAALGILLGNHALLRLQHVPKTLSPKSRLVSTWKGTPIPSLDMPHRPHTSAISRLLQSDLRDVCTVSGSMMQLPFLAACQPDRGGSHEFTKNKIQHPDLPSYTLNPKPETLKPPNRTKPSGPAPPLLARL